MLKTFVNKNYIFYGSSILITRGLEYVVLFFAAHYLTKSSYGDLEYYKKVIEVASSAFAFGFPALMLSYTKSKASKDYFFLLSCLFVCFIALITSIFLGVFKGLFFLVPFLFYALFFTGGITQTYILIRKGSRAVSTYKIVTSVLFYGVVFCAIYFFDRQGRAYIDVNYVLFPLFLIYVAWLLYKQNIIWEKVKRYWKLFKKLLYSSFTLVVSNFANMMFLYTDIFIIKIFSEHAKIDIANYSFALNIGNMLLLIPMTLVQVDIETLKRNLNYVKALNKKIMRLVILGAVGATVLFYVLTTYFIKDYKEIFTLFLVILVAKIFQAISPLYGTMLNIFKKFNTNLFINITALILNIILSFSLFKSLNLYGVAIASIVSLIFRQLLLYKFYYIQLKK